MWTKRPTYEEVLKQLEKDYVVKLPNRVALDVYDSFTMTQFREQQAALNQHAAGADENRDEATRQTAGEEGPTRHEFMQFAQQMASQAQGANATLQAGLQQSAEHHQQSLQQQATEFGRQLAEERVRQDQRDQFCTAANGRTCQTASNSISTRPSSARCR